MRNRAILAAVRGPRSSPAGRLLGAAATSAIDLIDRIRTGARRRPDPRVFFIEDTDLRGERHRAVAIAPVPGSRLSWRLTIPTRRVAVGVAGDAARGVDEGRRRREVHVRACSDGGTFEQLFKQHLDPFARQATASGFRSGRPARPYDGRGGRAHAQHLRPAPRAAGVDERNDLALWGVPEIVVR